jgi:hypothetical protein
MEVAGVMQSLQSDPQVSKLKGERAQIFAQNVTMDTANRMLNRQVMDRLKAIATGETEAAEDVTEPEAAPAEETVPAPETASEPAPQEDAAEPKADEGETTEDKPEEA